MLQANILAEVAAQFMVTGRLPDALDAAIPFARRGAAGCPPHPLDRREHPGRHADAVGRIEEGMADFERARIEADDDRDALLRYYVNSPTRSTPRPLRGLVSGQPSFELARAAGSSGGPVRSSP